MKNISAAAAVRLTVTAIVCLSCVIAGPPPLEFLKVGTCDPSGESAAPFVITPNTTAGQTNLTGFDMEMWSYILKQDVMAPYKFLTPRTYAFTDLISVISDGTVDVAFCALSVTPEQRTKLTLPRPTGRAG